MDDRTGRVYDMTEVEKMVEADKKHMKPLPENTPYKAGDRVGVNDRCPCGSGLKFKRCCMFRPEGRTP